MNSLVTRRYIKNPRSGDSILSTAPLRIAYPVASSPVVVQKLWWDFKNLYITELIEAGKFGELVDVLRSRECVITPQ